MKRLYAALGGVVLALSIFFQGSAFTTTAMSAVPAEYTVKESDFLSSSSTFQMIKYP
ncbi:hypothetical protein [Butyrivibrio sp. FC2001]|uniref:hypothetical protein n=1 Tax=Butyrivibrio sp. FC2001 TaxID=1280671 RepID=UPI000407EADF|nr:hypothetical protein [Butyrivibrio sp. FC2001]